VNLAQHNTLHFESSADALIEITSLTQLESASRSLAQRPRMILGSGSNVVLPDHIDATVLLNRLMGRRITDTGLATIASGEPWHALVLWSLDQGFAGLENLALIPGTVGAAPIQNIGAYGAEVKETICQVTAWDFHKHQLVQFSQEDCRFGYRDSVFKDPAQQGPWNAPRYFITEVTFQLQPMDKAVLKTNYGDLAAALAEYRAPISAQQVAQAVTAIRQRKLPDPDQLGNVGSFFKNPIISRLQADQIKALHPDLPVYSLGPEPQKDCKISAAWLIDRCGFKGVRRDNVGVHQDHALVLVHYGGGSQRALMRLAQEIQQSVVARFGVMLEPEPLIVPEGEV
jgi:UDP-N-acetylmuramate dehydrogenase